MPDIMVPLKQSAHSAELRLADQICGQAQAADYSRVTSDFCTGELSAYLDNIKRIHNEGRYDGGTAGCNTPFLQRELTA